MSSSMSQRDRGFRLTYRTTVPNASTQAVAFCPYPVVGAKKRRQESRKNTSKKRKLLYHMFAVCGGATVRVYDFPVAADDSAATVKTEEGGSGKFHLRQVYRVGNNREDFRALCFGQRRATINATSLADQQDVLCVGGAGASVAIISLQDGELVKNLVGCTHIVFDLKVCPKSASQQHNLLCAACRDEVRIWNLDSFATVAIFVCHPDGHRTDRYCVAWHPMGTRVAVGMKDQSISVWNFIDPSPAGMNTVSKLRPAAKFLDEAVVASGLTKYRHLNINLPPFGQDRLHFNPKLQRFAAATFRTTGQVDSLAWLGSDEEALLLSKTTNGGIISLWRLTPSDRKENKLSVSIVKYFRYDFNPMVDHGIIRCAVCCSSEMSPATLAVGASSGEIYVWDFEAMDWGSEEATEVLTHQRTAEKPETDMDKIEEEVELDGTSVESPSVLPCTRPLSGKRKEKEVRAAKKRKISNAASDIEVKGKNAHNAINVNDDEALNAVRAIGLNGKDAHNAIDVDDDEPLVGQSNANVIVIDDTDEDETESSKNASNTFPKDVGANKDHPIELDCDDPTSRSITNGSSTKARTATFVPGKGEGTENSPIDLDCEDVQHSSKTKAIRAHAKLSAVNKSTASTRRPNDELSGQINGKSGESTIQHRKRPVDRRKSELVPCKEVEEPTYTVREVVFSPDGTTMVACDVGGNIFQWQRPPIHPKSIDELALEFQAYNHLNDGHMEVEDDVNIHDDIDSSPSHSPGKQIPYYEDVPQPDLSDSNRVDL